MKESNQIIVYGEPAFTDKKLLGNQLKREPLKNVGAVVICLSAMSNKLIRKMKEIERDAVLEILQQAKKSEHFKIDLYVGL